MQCARSGGKRATGGAAAVSLKKHNGEGLDATVELGFPHTSRSTLGSKRCPSVWIQKTRPSLLENVCQSSANVTVCRAESNNTAVPFDLCNATPSCRPYTWNIYSNDRYIYITRGPSDPCACVPMVCTCAAKTSFGLSCQWFPKSAPLY